MFQIMLEQLERASGNMGVDVRLTADIIGAVSHRTKALGLDPTDTTGRELYQALLTLTELHDQFLAHQLGASDPTDVDDILPRLKIEIEKLAIPKTTWALKLSVAKRLLKATPPRKVMKHLGYRSVDSMLKRESMNELYSALRFVETPQWLATFVKKYHALTPQDFETRTIEVLLLDEQKWGNVTEPYVRTQHHNVTHLKELGVLTILPMPVKHLPGITIATLPLLLHYINEIRMYSSYFRFQQRQPKFGQELATILLEDPHDRAMMAGQQLHWRIIYSHFGREDMQNHPELFEPHIQPDDLLWRRAEDVLFRLEPALQFWQGMDYVGVVKDGAAVSFNLMDMAACLVNGLPYEQRSQHYMKRAVWRELYLRYIAQPSLEHQVMKQLDNQIISQTVIMEI
jgi:hypothetical protein